MKETRKIELLCQLRDLLNQTKFPTLRDAGLTEKDAQELAEDKLVEFIITEDEGEFLERHRVDGLTPKALGMLSRAGPVSAPLLRTTTHPQTTSVWSKIIRTLGIGLWDLAKIGFGVAIGWYLKKHYP